MEYYRRIHFRIVVWLVRFVRRCAPRNDRPFSAFVIITVVVASLSSLVSAGPIESIQILKISGRDGKAVIKTPDGSMQMIRVGDAFGKRGKVIEIADGRVVVEERTDQGTETVIIRVEDGKQRIERIRKTGDREPVLYAPK